MYVQKMQGEALKRRYISERGAAVKRLVCVLMMLVLLLSGGQAEFAPLFGSLNQYVEEGGALLWQMSVQVHELPNASEAAMEALGRLTENMSVSFMTRGGDVQESAMGIYDGAENVLDIRTQTDARETRVQWGNEIYVTDRGTPDALQVLFGENHAALPQVKKAREALWAQFEEVYAVLEKHGGEGEFVKATTSIKDVGASGRYIRHRLDEAAMNAAWQDMQPLLSHVYAALGVHMSDAERLSFTGDTEIHRIRDKEENDWGFSVSCRLLGKDGTAENVTLLLAWRPQRGFCIEWKIARGDDSDKGQISVAYPQWTETQTTLKTEGKITRKQDGSSETWELSGTMKRAAEEAGEHISGKLRMEKGKEIWTLEPDFVTTGTEGSGCVNIKKDMGSGRIARLTVNLKAAPCEGIVFHEGETVSLQDMEPWEKAFVLRNAQEEFARALIKWMAKIPARDRALITHLAGRSIWTDGETAPVLTQTDAKEEMPE